MNRGLCSFILLGTLVVVDPSTKGQTAEIGLSNVPIVQPAPGARTTPITHQPYFRGERDLFGYHPRYTPAPVNFDPDNIPYIRVGINPQGHDVYDEFTQLGVIQTLDATGQWITLSSWLDAIKAQYGGWDGLYNASCSNDEQIIFDSSGDAYTIVHTWYDASLGNKSMLLHSKDKCRTWRAYPLDHSMFFVKLEMPEAWNDQGNPPVILGSSYSFSGGSLYLITPTKFDDGSLRMPAPITLTSGSDNVSAIAPLHSGMGNSTITKGNKVYVVLLRNAPSPDGSSDTPQYVLAYDRATQTIAGPKFLGTGISTYGTPDVHVGPAITIDSQGYLHVVFGAHGGLFKYTKSVAPYSIDDWTTPVTIGNTGDAVPQWTYVSLVCDKSDTLHVVGRYSGYQYKFGLWYMRKKAGQAWGENLGPLVMPFRAFYSCWYHKLTMDRQGRLFLSYMYYGDQYDRGTWPSPTPEIDAYQAKWPWERPYLIDEASTSWGGIQGHEPCVIMSDDGGDHWRLALTSSLQVFGANTFENGLDGWDLVTNPNTNPIQGVSSYSYNGKTITPRTGGTFARCEASNYSKKAVRTISPAQPGAFTGYLNMAENTNVGMIQVAASGHLFLIMANSIPGKVSYRIDLTEVATAIPLTTQTWHQVKFTAGPNGLSGYWDGTLLFHSSLATSIFQMAFGSEWSSAPCGYDDLSFVPPAAVNGKVTLCDYRASVSGLPVTLELRTPGQSTGLEIDTATLDAAGNYSFVTPLTGTYDITAKAAHWLRQKQMGLAFVPGGSTTVNFALTNGDADGDNRVTAGDLPIVLSTMDGGSGGSADLDGDGEVTTTDLAIVLKNIDRMGDS